MFRSCSVCTFNNVASSMECEMCGTPFAVEEQQTPAVLPQERPVTVEKVSMDDDAKESDEDEEPGQGVYAAKADDQDQEDEVTPSKILSREPIESLLFGSNPLDEDVKR